MTAKVRKQDARQGERRPGQERVLLLSGIIGTAALAGTTLAFVLLRPFGA